MSMLISYQSLLRGRSGQHDDYWYCTEAAAPPGSRLASVRFRDFHQEQFVKQTLLVTFRTQ